MLSKILAGVFAVAVLTVGGYAYWPRTPSARHVLRAADRASCRDARPVGRRPELLPVADPDQLPQRRSPRLLWRSTSRTPLLKFWQSSTRSEVTRTTSPNPLVTEGVCRFPPGIGVLMRLLLLAAWRCSRSCSPVAGPVRRREAARRVHAPCSTART